MRKSNTKSKKSAYVACHESHPPLVITVKGEDFLVYGGSCHHPVVKDRDVTVGLDYGFSPGKKGYPWVKGESFSFTIKDMGVPPSVADFTSLLCYLDMMIRKGKKVFIGCIGGHGRTGVVLAALVTYMTGEKDSITYVRKHYCKKVVESKEQVDWLHKNFDIDRVSPTKEAHKSGNINTKGGYNGLYDTGLVRSGDYPTIYSPIESSLSVHMDNEKESK